MGRITQRWLRSGAPALMIAVLVLTVTVPAAATVPLEPQERAPCLGVAVIPPYAHVDPNCVNPYRMTGASSPVEASAVAQDLDAQLSWSYAGASGSVAYYLLYKGHTPQTMTWLASVDGRSSSYEDEGALLEAGKAWYQVTAVLREGGRVDSVPFLLEAVVET